MISEQIKEHPLQPLHSQKLHTEEAVGNPSGPRWYWINLSCRSETNWHKLIQSPEPKDKCALYLWCNWEQTMSSGDLTAPFYEKKMLFFQKVWKGGQFLVGLCPIQPKQSSGADQHHPPGTQYLHTTSGHWCPFPPPIDRITESAGLEKTSEIIKSNLNYMGLSSSCWGRCLIKGFCFLCFSKSLSKW